MRGPQEPLLTVAIPTFNRARYLDLCLASLVPQMREGIELLVLDNASDDDTSAVVAKYASHNALRYVRNEANIGSDRNIAQCFAQARGRYVLTFGDDDILLAGALDRVLAVLRGADHGVVFLKPYGYDSSAASERPFSLLQGPRIVRNAQDFIKKVHVYCTFISSNVINKHLVGDVDLERAVGTNLVQVELFCRAALAAQSNVYFRDYLVAAKRNNSGGYDYLRVFVANLNAALDHAMRFGLAPRTKRAIAGTMVFRHLPYYVLKMRAEEGAAFDGAAIHRFLTSSYPGSLLYRICLYPVVRLPMPLAAVWGWLMILASRVASGEFGRILTFAAARLQRSAA